MNYKKKVSETVVNNFINDDGELTNQVVESKTQVIVLPDTDQFFLTYLSIMALMDNIDKVALKVLFFSIKHAVFNTNKVSLHKAMLTEFQIQSGLTYQTIKNAISRLKKSGALISLGGGTYRVNPKYFWKGDRENRRPTMEYILKVECPGCEEILMDKVVSKPAMSVNKMVTV